MANLSQIRREKMLSFLETLKEQHSDDESLIAINQIEKELTSKKYGLVWEEHEEEVDIRMQTEIPVFCEIPDREIVALEPDSEFNFLLEGDNLHSLKLLEKTHRGKIDIIYIDPPYNTVNKDFVYNDTQIGVDDAFRHSKWLSFMAERLKIAFKLLAKDGVIFISIDDNEQATLKLLCDEIFGEKNNVSQLVWEKKKKGSFLSNSITNIKEYVLVYAKDISCFNGLIGEINTNTETYPCINASNKREMRHIPAGIESKYKEADYFLPKGTEISDTTMSIVLHSDLVIKNGVLNQDLLIEGNWRYSQEAMEEYALKKELYITRDLYLRRIVSDARYKTLKDLLPRVGENAEMNYNSAISLENLFESGWGSNEDADEELRLIFGKQHLFSYPKPTRLICKLIASCRKKDAIVLDFFAGSGTTGHAVLKLNQIDGGNRHYILCTNNENGICENITYERQRKAICGYGDNEGIPANLKYYTTKFLPKDSDTLYDDLLLHIKEMIQLEYGVKVDNQRYVMIMNDDEMDAFEKRYEPNSSVREIFINQEVLLSSSQEKLLRNINTHIIPDCYFDFELREAGELW